MNWKSIRRIPWIDTRARFVAGLPRNGTLLDIGSAMGETLSHFAELRPDLRLLSTDIEGMPEKYPVKAAFHRADIVTGRLPWPDGSVDGITCMHVIEHLSSLENLMKEAHRLLKPGGAIFFETPHPKTVGYDSAPGADAGTFTLNFYDDVTHVAPVSAGRLAAACRAGGLRVVGHGPSRNWFFALSHLFFWACRGSHRKYTARVHLLGWSFHLIAARD